MTKITRAKGGTAERTEDVNKIQVPDLWHIALSLEGTIEDTNLPQGQVLECWHLCHDLLDHIRENN